MNKKLRWVKHDRHIDILKEFYSLNKYYMTEQLKDSIADAIECLEYIEDNKICGKEKCRSCENFGWICDLKGENPNGFYTCEMTNTKIALTDKDYEPTREDFIKSQQDIYKAVLGLDAPENTLTTVQEMNEKAKEVKNITDEWDRVRMSGDKRAIAQYKADHGFTMTKEEMDVLEEEK